jgi:hypothetical protein
VGRSLNQRLHHQFLLSSTQLVRVQRRRLSRPGSGALQIFHQPLAVTGARLRAARLLICSRIDPGSDGPQLATHYDVLGIHIWTRESKRLDTDLMELR